MINSGSNNTLNMAKNNSGTKNTNKNSGSSNDHKQELSFNFINKNNNKKSK